MKAKQGNKLNNVGDSPNHAVLSWMMQMNLSNSEGVSSGSIGVIGIQ
jgi:hypothetical protein